MTRPQRFRSSPADLAPGAFDRPRSAVLLRHDRCPVGGHPVHGGNRRRQREREVDPRTWRIWRIVFGSINSAIGTAAGLLLVLPTITVVLLSSATTGGMAQSLVPKVRLELPIAAADATDLRRLIADFAKDEGFRLWDFGARMSPWQGRELFYVRLMRSNVDVLVDDFLEQNKIFIAIYDFGQSPAEFEAVVTKFKKMLGNRWPERLRAYTGE